MDNHIPEVFREFQNTIKEMNAVHTEKIGEQDTLETKMLDSEVRNDIQGFEGRDVVVFGNPIEIGEKLDHLQGDNPYFAGGNCGLVSTANFLNLCGISAADENMITKYTIDHDECMHGWFVPFASRGGVTTENEQKIIKDFGIGTNVFQTFEPGGSIEDIARQIEAGYVGIMGVNAGYLWDDPGCVEDGFMDHDVTLTGTVRDAQTGELLGITICDSGDRKACDVLSLDKLQQCYVDIPGARVIFSDSPMRVV